MEDLTNVVEEVVTDVTEEVVTKVGAGAVITGVCAATGAATIAYVAIKGVKWAYGKVKAAIDAKAGNMDLEDDAVIDAVYEEK